MKPSTAYYQIADITLQILSDLPITDKTFDQKFDIFQTEGPGDDVASIHHHFSLIDVDKQDLGREVYHRAPWVIYQQPDGWFYLGIVAEKNAYAYWKIATFNPDHSVGHIYHPDDIGYMRGNIGALTTFPTDQILIARLLADRQGCFLHSAGAIINGAGVLFVGHSGAGKSTTTRMLMNLSSQTSPVKTEILCDDRNIIRLWPDGWRVYGSWSHGEISHVSSASAPLKAIFFLEQAHENRLIQVSEPKEVTRRLLACLIKPFVTVDWWDKSLNLVEQLSAEIPFYQMRFDKSGIIIDQILHLL